MKYFYTRDHLGSVREAADVNGALASRVDYGPYGQQAVTVGAVKNRFGYTGHFIHGPSGLYLTLHRALDSATGRWLSRDPLEERAGANAYVYVLNNPVNKVDPYGLVIPGPDLGYPIFENPPAQEPAPPPTPTPPLQNPTDPYFGKQPGGGCNSHDNDQFRNGDVD